MSNDLGLQMNRRHFFSRTSAGLGGAVLSNLMVGARNATADNTATGILGAPHFPAKAKRVIYLFQSGGPSQLETFDYKPLLKERQGQELPDSVRQGQRLTNMSGNQSSLPLVGSASRFEKRGKCGTWVSDLLPHTAKIVDDLCITIRPSPSFRLAIRSRDARRLGPGSVMVWAHRIRTCRRSV